MASSKTHLDELIAQDSKRCPERGKGCSCREYRDELQILRDTVQSNVSTALLWEVDVHYILGPTTLNHGTSWKNF